MGPHSPAPLPPRCDHCPSRTQNLIVVVSVSLIGGIVILYMMYQVGCGLAWAPHVALGTLLLLWGD